jgi:hypothetical protein
MTLAMHPSLPGELREELPTSNSQGLFTDVTYSRAAIQRRESILTWIVILSVYGADTIA